MKKSFACFPPTPIYPLSCSAAKIQWLQLAQYAGTTASRTQEQFTPVLRGAFDAVMSGNGPEVTHRGRRYEE